MMVIFWILAEELSREAEDLGSKQISALNGGKNPQYQGQCIVEGYEGGVCKPNLLKLGPCGDKKAEPRWLVGK